MYTRNRICDTMLKMMEQKPYSKVKISELVDKAEVSRSTFYFYFESIISVVDALEDDLLGMLPSDETLAMAYQSAQDGSVSSITIAGLVAKRLEKHLNAFRILSGPNGRNEFQEKFHTKSLHMLRLMSSRSVGDKSTSLLNEFWSGSQWYAYKWWANKESNLSAQDLIDLTVLAMTDLKKLFLNASNI